MMHEGLWRARQNDVAKYSPGLVHQDLLVVPLAQSKQPPQSIVSPSQASASRVLSIRLAIS